MALFYELEAARRQLEDHEIEDAKRWKIRAGARWAASRRGQAHGFLFLSVQGAALGARDRGAEGRRQGKLFARLKPSKTFSSPPLRICVHSSDLPADWSDKWAEACQFFEEKVSPTQRETLDADISEEEILAALKAMPRGKCPGTDGFPAQFFLATWACSGSLFMRALQQVWHSGSLGELFNASLIALLPKGGDLTSTDQLRPISLLSTLYKAIAKALALRLQQSLNSWLEPEQRGFTMGRSIADNLLLFREAKWWAYHHQLPVVFLLLDFSKAYDRIEWRYVQAALRQLGFGPKSCRWVRILSQDANGRLVINGRISRLFWLFRSVRQGCTLAPTLFVLVTDLLVRMVKLNVRIRGLIDPVGRELKLSIFADDTLKMVLRELATLIALMAVLELFCLLTGLRINWEKTVAISSPDNSALPGPCSLISGSYSPGSRPNTWDSPAPQARKICRWPAMCIKRS